MSRERDARPAGRPGAATRLEERQVVETVGTLDVTELRLWCAAGWVSPAEGASGPVFDDVDMARVRLVCRLRDDVGLDSEAIPVVLSLLDQLHGVRRELHALARAVAEQDAAVAARIRDAYRTAAARAGRGGGR